MQLNPRSFKSIKQAAKEGRAKSRGDLMRQVQTLFRKKDKKQEVVEPQQESPAPPRAGQPPVKKTTPKRKQGGS